MLPSCDRCSISLDPLHDVKRNKEFCKHCIKCRNKKRNKSTRPLCIHNKRKSNCKECGGNSLCQHFIIKFECKLCNGSQICLHNKRRRYCKECNGNGLCEHLLQKNKCKYCRECRDSKDSKDPKDLKDSKDSKDPKDLKECVKQYCCHNKIISECIECEWILNVLEK